MADDKSKGKTTNEDEKPEDLDTQAEANVGVSSAALNPVYLTTAEDDVPKRFRAKSDKDAEGGTDDAAREEFTDKPAVAAPKVVEPLKEEDSKPSTRKGKGDA